MSTDTRKIGRLMFFSPALIDDDLDLLCIIPQSGVRDLSDGQVSFHGNMWPDSAVLNASIAGLRCKSCAEDVALFLGAKTRVWQQRAYRGRSSIGGNTGL